jgi:hypothetical protein
MRRAHLFAGLFLVPWVLLYGVTGFLFNHPEAFPDREVRTAGRTELVGTDLEGFPTAPQLAESVVLALNSASGTSDFRLIDRDDAVYSRPLFVTATGHGREHSVRFDPDTGAAFIRSTTASEPVRKPGDRWPGGSGLTLEHAPRDRLARGVPALLARLGIEADATVIRNPPELICDVAVRNQRWRVAYNLQSGALSALPQRDALQRLSTRRFLTGLHLSFSYPARVDARWWWAVAVDAMSMAMVFWGVSGLCMWWQLKRLRIWGLATLIVSGVAATLLAAGMNGILNGRL